MTVLPLLSKKFSIACLKIWPPTWTSNADSGSSWKMWIKSDSHTQVKPVMNGHPIFKRELPASEVLWEVSWLKRQVSSHSSVLSRQVLDYIHVHKSISVTLSRGNMHLTYQHYYIGLWIQNPCNTNSLFLSSTQINALQSKRLSQIFFTSLSCIISIRRTIF